MKLVFLLEEESMKHFLDGILPKILPPDVGFITVPHEGKSDLQKSVPIKLRAWKEPGVKFVIVQDQDTGDCRELKRKLVELCGDTTQEVLIRIACHELEAWYFGDLEAVSKAYGKNITVLAKKKQYRVPDDIISPKRELILSCRLFTCFCIIKSFFSMLFGNSSKRLLKKSGFRNKISESSTASIK